MKTPKAKQVVRFFGLWGFDDIFTTITRRSDTRLQLFLTITELVEKRNNIAHGDFAEEATRSEVAKYRQTVATFCERVDRSLARKLKRLGVRNPW
jgi:hypothetical protein